MEQVLQRLVNAASKVKRPSRELKTAIGAARKELKCRDTGDQFAKLSKVLQGVDPAIEITFSESPERGNLYGLTVECHDRKLIQRLAKAFGADEQEVRDVDGCTEFDAFSDWHGRGEVDLRKLADEIIQMEGEFFTVTYTVGQIHRQA